MENDFAERFARIRTEYQVIQKDFQQRQWQDAPHFNIFRTVHLTEVTHSSFLADLLNPRGSHGQDDLFLRCFLAYCREKFDEQAGTVFGQANMVGNEWRITTEHFVGPYGRLDILIQNPESGTLIIIENKIRANERVNQLRDYGTWLKSQKKQFRHWALLFLTPTGLASESHGGEHYYSISYQQDIAGWLRAAVDKVEATRVRETIHQYLELISEGTMSEIDDLGRFLLRPDNLPTALELVQRVDQVRDRMHARFWLKVADEMKLRLEQSGFDQRWKIEEPPSNYRQAWANCRIVPRSEWADLGKPHAEVSLQQGRPQSSYRLHCGISWTVTPEHPVGVPEYQNLRQYLLEHQLQVRDEGWWLTGNDIGYSAVGDRFLLRMGTDEDEFIREVVDLPFQLFRDTVELLEALNRAVAGIPVVPQE